MSLGMSSSVRCVSFHFQCRATYKALGKMYPLFITDVQIINEDMYIKSDRMAYDKHIIAIIT